MEGAALVPEPELKIIDEEISWILADSDIVLELAQGVDVAVTEEVDASTVDDAAKAPKPVNEEPDAENVVVADSEVAVEAAIEVSDTSETVLGLRFTTSTSRAPAVG